MEERIWHKAYAPGVPTSIRYDKTTMPEALRRTAHEYPNTTALIMMGKKISYRKLDHLVDRFAASLHALGLRKGDKVSLAIPNLPQTLIAAYAVFRLGAVVVMTNPLYTERELIYQLNDSGSSLCICLDLLVPRIKKIQPQTGIRNIIACHIRDYLPFPKKQMFPLVKKDMHRRTVPGEGVLDFMDLVASGRDGLPETEVTWEDTAALMYTGGTTGVSKGVVLSHANCSIVVQQFRAWINTAVPGEERLIAIYPYFHVAGFTAMMNQSVWGAFTQILVPRPTPETIMEMTGKYRPTFFSCVPTLYVGVLNHPRFAEVDFSCVKGCLSGAAPLAHETIRDWESEVGATIVEVYGMTETTTFCHGNPWGGKTKAGSVGIPIPDTDCRIVDVENGEQEMPLGQQGEVLIKGPQVAEEYYKKPEETAAAFRDGWFYTGDIGYMDEDGYLFVVDRKKDMIIAGGYNIYPREIDEVLYEHPKIAEACAVGVPDPYRGETVRAYCVVRSGENLTGDDVIAFCRERLAPYKVPRQVHFIDELPKSAVGKVLRRQLKEMALEGAGV